MADVTDQSSAWIVFVQVRKATVLASCAFPITATMFGGSILFNAQHHFIGSSSCLPSGVFWSKAICRPRGEGDPLWGWWLRSKFHQNRHFLHWHLQSVSRKGCWYQQNKGSRTLATLTKVESIASSGGTAVADRGFAQWLASTA